MFNKLSRVHSRVLPNIGLIGYLMVVLLLLGGALTACNTSAATMEPEQVNETRSNYAGKKVLFVNSYHEGYEWSDGIEAGLQDILKGSGVELEFVRLDTKRNPTDEFGREAGIKAKAEIEAFKPVEYWNIHCKLERMDDGQSFRATLHAIDGRRVEKEPIKGKEVALIPDQATAEALKKRLEKAHFVVDRLEK